MIHYFGGRPVTSMPPAEAFGFGRGQIPASMDAIIDKLRKEMEFDPVNWGDQGITLWEEIEEDTKAYIAVLQSGSMADVHLVLSTLFATALTHGFQQGSFVQNQIRAREDIRYSYAGIIVDRLLRLTEAVGLVDVKSPEHGAYTRPMPDCIDLIDRLEEHLGFELAPPGIDGGLYGIEHRSGIFTDRHFDAIYLAWRLRHMARLGLNYSRVVEIGGGAGYLAYYGRKAGIKRYVLVDLLGAGLVQFIMLAAAFGKDVISLGKSGPNISVIREHGFDDIQLTKTNIVVNVDSFPEMPYSSAFNYINAAKGASALLSVNQESRMANGDGTQNVVRQLCSSVGMSQICRSPSWLRTGYVEELYCPTTAAVLDV